MALDFRLLGPLEVFADDKVDIEGRRQQVVLAMLLLDPGRVITVARLVDAVYGDEPPRTAETQIHICVSQLRRRFGPHTDRDLIITHSAGYLIQLDESELDVAQFRRHVAKGREAVRAGDPETAVSRLRAGLAIWRGEALAGMTSGPVQNAAVRLNEERFSALQDCIDLELGLRRHHGLLGELTELVAAHPLREKLHTQLAVALYRADRQVEALAVLRAYQHTLLEDHGLSPSEELRRLQRAILDNDPALDAPVREPPKVVPHQLPASTADFVGRADLVAQVRGRLAAADGVRRTPIVVISGQGGVGKTTLALHAAHQIREHFPDGQLYAHLRSTDAAPMPAEQVLEWFLRALGVPPSILPTDPVELAAMYRSAIAGHRILVLLDDVDSTEQVLPLLPGDEHCSLLLTSRSGLHGLNGARRVELEVFDPATSLALLSRVIGEARVRDEEQAAYELAKACGQLPLGLRIAAAKLAARRHWRIARMTRRLADERHRLDELTMEGASVRATISVSYQGLDAGAARLLLLLGALDPPDFAGWVAAPLLDTTPDAAGDLLDVLVEARLVDVEINGDHQVRYRLHDLTRTFARELSTTEVPPAGSAAAQRRLLRCWLFLAGEAHRREHGGNYTVLHSDAELWPLPEPAVDELIADPIEWLQSEYAHLVAAVRQAAELGCADLSWDLAVSCVTLFESHSRHDAWRETHDLAWQAAHRAGDRRGEAAIEYSRGGLALVEQRMDDARQHLETALAWFEAAGDRHGRGLALRHLAHIARLAGDYQVANARYQQALADLQTVGDPVGEAHVLRNLAQIQLESGRPDRAEELLRRSLATCLRVGTRRVEAQVQHRLGEALLAQDKVEAAATAFAAALRLAESTNDPAGRAYALLGTGRVALAVGDLAAAKPALCEAVAAAREGRSRLAEGQALLALTQLAVATGEGSTAATRLGEAETIFTAIGADAWVARLDEVRRTLPQS